MTWKKGHQFDFFREINVDNFAGGGGVDTGWELATGSPMDIAINHDPAAIRMHMANHPHTRHYCESVWDVNPREVVMGRPVGLCWQSPDCTYFSLALGDKPKDSGIRGLAWNTLRWSGQVEPRINMLENVVEFQTWGPLIAKRDKVTGRVVKLDGTVAAPGEVVPRKEQHLIPDPDRKGKTFRRFVRAIRDLGYEVEWNELRACDYGAPTIRKRFFMVMRRDNQPIVWPEPTHGDPKSLSVQSGRLKPWRTASECIDWSKRCPSIFERKRPLSPNTMRRIYKGIQKFIVNSESPYVAPVKWDVHDNSAHVAAFLIQYHSETTNGDVRGQSLDRPLLTQDTSNRYALCTTYLMKMKGDNIGQPIDEPLHTITAGGLHHAEVRAFLVQYNGASVGFPLGQPLGTITTHDRFGLVVIHGTPYQIVDIGMRMLEPHELFACQGFPKEYIIDRDHTGKPYPKTEQVARCGHSVPPQLAMALIQANMPEYCERPAAKKKKMG